MITKQIQVDVWILKILYVSNIYFKKFSRLLLVSRIIITHPLNIYTSMVFRYIVFFFKYAFFVTLLFNYNPEKRSLKIRRVRWTFLFYIPVIPLCFLQYSIQYIAFFLSYSVKLQIINQMFRLFVDFPWKMYKTSSFLLLYYLLFTFFINY